MPKKWEYQYMEESGELSFLEGARMKEKQLNKFGNDGWELIHYYHPETGQGWMILKREKRKEKKPAT